MNGIAKHFSAGDVIFRQGDAAGDMYLIRRGRVAVSLLDGGVSTNLATLKAGDFFGEMSLFDGKPRSATVTALEDVGVEAISRENLSSQVDTTVWDLLVRMSGRIRAADDSLGEHSSADASRRDALSNIAIRRNLYY